MWLDLPSNDTAAVLGEADVDNNTSSLIVGVNITLRLPAGFGLPQQTQETNSPVGRDAAGALTEPQEQAPSLTGPGLVVLLGGAATGSVQLNVSGWTATFTLNVTTTLPPPAIFASTTAPIPGGSAAKVGPASINSARVAQPLGACSGLVLPDLDALLAQALARPSNRAIASNATCVDDTSFPPSLPPVQPPSMPPPTFPLPPPLNTSGASPPATEAAAADAIGGRRTLLASSGAAVKAKRVPPPPVKAGKKKKKPPRSPPAPPPAGSQSCSQAPGRLQVTLLAAGGSDLGAELAAMAGALANYSAIQGELCGLDSQVR